LIIDTLKQILNNIQTYCNCMEQLSVVYRRRRLTAILPPTTVRCLMPPPFDCMYFLVSHTVLHKYVINTAYCTVIESCVNSVKCVITSTPATQTDLGLLIWFAVRIAMAKHITNYLICFPEYDRQ